MKRAGHFEKVSFTRFCADWIGTFGEVPEEEIRAIYDTLSLPVRATVGSAGYDFASPLTFTLAPGESIKIPTGIRAVMKPNYVLLCFPRSGLGFRYRLQLDNTVGIIDSDYAGSENEGHIFCKITNDTREGKAMTVQAGKGFMQGIFLEYAVTEDDAAAGLRNGGFGSTDEPVAP